MDFEGISHQLSSKLGRNMKKLFLIILVSITCCLTFGQNVLFTNQKLKSKITSEKAQMYLNSNSFIRWEKRKINSKFKLDINQPLTVNIFSEEYHITVEKVRKKENVFSYTASVSEGGYSYITSSSDGLSIVIYVNDEVYMIEPVSKLEYIVSQASTDLGDDVSTWNLSETQNNITTPETKAAVTSECQSKF